MHSGGLRLVFPLEDTIFFDAAVIFSRASEIYCLFRTRAGIFIRADFLFRSVLFSPKVAFNVSVFANFY